MLELVSYSSSKFLQEPINDISGEKSGSAYKTLAPYRKIGSRFFVLISTFSTELECVAKTALLTTTIYRFSECSLLAVEDCACVHEAETGHSLDVVRKLLGHQFIVLVPTIQNYVQEKCCICGLILNGCEKQFSISFPKKAFCAGSDSEGSCTTENY